jgi:hypothetical protein
MPRRPGGETLIRARLASAPGLTATEAHALAGLIDAEGYLAINPNNRSGWQCALSINLRDDDRQILVDYREKLGIGTLRRVPARNGSRPQVSWLVTSKSECRLMMELLDQHVLRSRKHAEYEIWRDAVSIWGARDYGLPAAGRERLARLAATIRRHRRYNEGLVDGPPPHLSGQCAPDYFAGFFSGEGSFALGPRSARFVVKLRRDDKPLLHALSRRFGLGSVCDVAVPEPWSPQAVWHVTSADDVLSGIALFDSIRLLGRKARQYAAWRPGAQAIARAIRSKSPVDERLVGHARLALADATRYHPPTLPLVRGDCGADARDAYLNVMKEWAAATAGPLTCTEYTAVRRDQYPHWPKRETLAREFGGWYEALRCAGLEERAVRRPRSAR